MQDNKAVFQPLFQVFMNTFERVHHNIRGAFGKTTRMSRSKRQHRHAAGDVEKCNLEFLEYSMHKIRSPLASIIGYAELLTETDFKNDPEFINHACQVMIKQGQHIMQTTEDLVIAARMNAGNQVSNPMVFSLAELLSDLVDEVRKQSERDIHYIRQNGDGLVFGDALQLRTVFIHLLDNAQKYSAEDQPIDVILERTEPDHWVQVQVKDHGIGISAKESSKLFKQFGRINNEQTTGIPGSGLGLYIVNKIIEQHRGKVEVHSMPGEGTTFSVYLPAAETDQPNLDSGKQTI